MEMNEDLINEIYELIEVSRSSGKIKKGSNEATKALERSSAKLVVYAGDISPKEIVMHLPLLAKEREILCLEVPSKKNLGAAAGLEVATTAVAIIEEGDGKEKLNLIKAKIEELNKIEN